MPSVRIKFTAREYQKPLIDWFRNGGKRAACVWHRRSTCRQRPDLNLH